MKNRPEVASAEVRTAVPSAGVAQVRGASDWGMVGGLLVCAASALVFALALVQAVFQAEGWSARVGLLLEGLIWSALVGAAGVVVLLLSQALRCLCDLTYRTGRPLDEGG